MKLEIDIINILKIIKIYLFKNHSTNIQKIYTGLWEF